MKTVFIDPALAGEASREKSKVFVAISKIFADLGEGASFVCARLTKKEKRSIGPFANVGRKALCEGVFVEVASPNLAADPAFVARLPLLVYGGSPEEVAQNSLRYLIDPQRYVAEEIGGEAYRACGPVFERVRKAVASGKPFSVRLYVPSLGRPHRVLQGRSLAADLSRR